MASLTPPAAGPPKQRSAGWRGGTRREVARHQWQRDPGSLRFFNGHWRTVRVAGLFLAAAGLTVLLLYYLLYAPVRTPVLAVVATQYTWPLAANAWAAEDLAALRDLDQQTLHLQDLSEAWRSKEHGLAELKSRLAGIRLRHPAWQPVILYFSMHGAVNGAGEACLLPPGAAPQDSATWLPLADVLAAIKAADLSPQQPKLLVLDCNRQLVNWHAGILLNTFADSLAAAVQQADVPGLVVLNSTSPGERALAAAELRGSVFGHYLRLGLAGVADHWSAGGNGNGRVSLHELTKYLVRNVDAWTRHHHGERQQPMLVRADTPDFDVAVAMQSRSWRRIEQRAQRIERPAPPVAASRLYRHWSRLDGLREAQLWRFSPTAWRTFEHRLLALEALVASGSAYAAQAKTLDEELERDLTAAHERLRRAQDSGSLLDHVRVLQPETQLPLPPGHSLPLVRLAGSGSVANVRLVEDALAACQTAASAANASAALAAFQRAELPPTSEFTLLATWDRYHVPAQWTSAATLGEILAARRTLERLAAFPAAPQSAGGVGDERVLPFLKASLENLAATCRALEDAAIAGPGSGPVESLLETAQAEGQAADAAATAMAKAFAQRDQVWAELLYLAQWLTRPQDDAAAQAAADEHARQELLPLVADLADLEGQLIRRADDGQPSSVQAWTAEGAAREVEMHVAALVAYWNREVERLQAALASPLVAGQIEAALALPLLTADSRERLRQKQSDVAAALAAEFRADDADALGAAATAPVAVPYRERVANWGRHPLVALLTGGESSAAGPADWPAWGEIVRGALRQLSLGDATGPSGARLVSQAAQRAADAAAERPAADLEALCAAESRYRRAASLWFEPPSEDPVATLRSADLQQLLLTAAQRALDDFYGPPRRGGEPLFALAAASDLEAARALAPPSTAVAERLANLRQTLSERRIAAVEALAVGASDILIADQATMMDTELAVRVKQASAAAALPAGKLAVFLTDPAGRLGTTEAVALPAGEKTVLLEARSELAAADLANRGPELTAVATLRGNEALAPVLLRAPGGTRVEHSRPAYGPPQVTLLATETRSASVVVVLDCSSSMQRPTVQEGPGGAVPPSRMEVAKGAVRALLGELANQGSVRVGVVFFGHRVGWSTTEDNKLLRQTDWPEEIPAELRPAGDVQVVLPLGRFDPAAAALVNDKLAAVRPWGESPLYLAVSEGLAEFGKEDSGERTVVVITDGENYQFNAQPAQQRTSQQVVEAARRSRARVYIVGFDLAAQESARAAREFDTIAETTGGQFLPASGATAFVTSLQSLLRPAEFRVQGTSGRAASAVPGRTVELPLPARPAPYTVSYEGMELPLVLSGGERVELAVSRAERRLKVLPLASPQVEPLVREGGTASSLLAGLHRTVRASRGVVFPISLQDRDGHFLPRPAELWVEITPQAAPLAEEGATYFFYDAPFEAGTSVPVVRLEAQQWPAGAGRASVRLWMRPTPTEPLAQVALSRVADRVPDSGGGFEVPGFTGLRYQARTLHASGGKLVIGVVERHSAASPGVGSLKVALLPAPDGATHQFDTASRVALHTFLYNQPAEGMLDKVQIVFTSRTAITTGALRLAREVVVGVAERADLLELTPP